MTKNKTNNKQKNNKKHGKNPKRQIMGTLVKGRGGYFSDLFQKHIVRPLGDFARSRANAFIPGLGDMGEAVFKKVTGQGDYKIKQNELLTDTQAPSFASSEGIIVTHREYLGDVTSSTGFAVTAYPINPGQNSTFPWGASVANNFEQYELLGCIFHYTPTSGTAVGVTNTALGTVILATLYDTYEPAFSSKMAMENHEFASSTVPFLACDHPIECAPRLGTEGVHFTRAGAVPTGADQRLYDKGVFYLATVGMQAVNVIGELWVTYKMRLLKPHYDAAGAASANKYAHYSFVPTTSFALAGAARLASSTLLPSDVTISGANVTLTIPGRYYIVYSASAATTLTFGSGISGGVIGGSTPSNAFTAGTSAAFAVTNTNLILYQQCIQVPTTGGGFAVLAPTVVTGAYAGDLFIFLVPSTFQSRRTSPLEELVARLELLEKERDNHSGAVAMSTACQSLASTPASGWFGAGGSRPG